MLHENVSILPMIMLMLVASSSGYRTVLCSPGYVRTMRTAPPHMCRQVVPGESIDTVGDGMSDRTFVDTNCDGRVDSVEYQVDGQRGPSGPRGPATTVRPGDTIDTLGDRVADRLLIDTVGDGRVDSLIALNETLPYQVGVNRLLSSSQYQLLSIFATVVSLAVTAMGPALLSPEALAVADSSIARFFMVEFGLRWWAAGFRTQYLRSPYAILDGAILLPPGIDALASILAQLGIDNIAATPLATGPLAPLRLLRAGRVLRLLRYFQPETFERVLGREADEVQRTLARTAFSAAAIVLVAAGVEFEVEAAVNPAISSYLDAVYFSITTLTTVGFGDIVPLTPTGKAVIALEMVAAVTVIPSGLASVAEAAAKRDAIEATPSPSDEDAALLASLLRRERTALLQASRGANGLTVVCSACGLDDHDEDARFCKRCGSRLASGSAESGV